jgi:acetyl esterase/lipase
MKIKLKTVVFLGASVISWALGAQEVKIKSSVDGTLQPCFVQAPAEGLKKVPLLVGLHSWSTSYTSAHPRDFMAKECAARGWAFVYPHFRGPNNNPDACGSEKAVADVLDSVAWAQKEFDIDAKRIYIAGGSGGGHMTLMAIAAAPGLFAAAAAFCPISDLARWHADGLRLKTEYPGMLERSCLGTPAEKPGEYRRRSPLWFLDRASSVKVYLAAGIHDGHRDQSVPVGHVIRAFNRLVPENSAVGENVIGYIEKNEKVPPDLVFTGSDPFYGHEKRIHMRRTAGNARLTVFEGGHQDNYPAAIDFLSRQSLGGRVDWALPEKAGAAEKSAISK